MAPPLSGYSRKNLDWGILASNCGRLADEETKESIKGTFLFTRNRELNTLFKSKDSCILLFSCFLVSESTRATATKLRESCGESCDIVIAHASCNLPNGKR